MFFILQEVGEFLHRAKSGRLIVRLSKQVDPGSTLLDSKGRKVGNVVELMGPTSRPYASAAPMTSRVDGKKGEKVFLNR